MIEIMKNIIYITLIVIAILTTSAKAQTGARFGLKGGYSLSTQYGITPPDIPYDVETYYRHGFAVGIMAYFPINKNFGIQQEVLYVTKGSREDITLKTFPVTTHTEYDLNYIEIPIVFRYTFANLWDIDIYGSTGFALSIMLDGNSRLDGVVVIGEQRTPFADSSNLEGVDIFDYGFLYGAGLKFELFEKECFFEYRFNIGWNMLLMPTADGEDPAPLRNQDYIFVLGFYL